MAPVQGEMPIDGEIVAEPIQGEVQVQPGMEEAPLSPDMQVQMPGAEMPTSVEGEDLNTGDLFAPNTPIAVGDKTGVVVMSNPEENLVTVKLDDNGQVQEVHESKVTILGNQIFEDNKQITTQIEQLILETKKRKASEVKEPHFVQFLTENKKRAWYDLVPEDKEKVTFAINESKTDIYSEAQLLHAINETLAPSKSYDEILLEKMPSSLQPIWESLDDKHKTSVLSQAKLYPNLNNDLKIEKFWESRNLLNYQSVNETKQVLNENRVIDNSTLSDTEIDNFISRIKNIGR